MSTVMLQRTWGSREWRIFPTTTIAMLFVQLCWIADPFSPALMGKIVFMKNPAV